MTEWKNFVPTLEGKNIVLAPWCNVEACEEDIKDRSGKEAKAATEGLSGAAKSLCIPFEQPEEGVAGHTCVGCGKEAAVWCLFGRSY